MDVQYIVEMWLFLAAISCLLDRSEGMSLGDKKKLRNQVVEMFHHAYDNYMDNAFPADELMPLSCKGRDRGTMPSRGDVDDALGNFSLTLVDTLDTLVVLGEVETFDKAVRLVIQHVSFDRDVVVSVFETNIRMVGGLLSGHVLARYLKRKKLGLDWYQDELLEKAKELGYRLLPAFNTTTGIPFPRVNLRHGVLPELARTGHEKDTCTACAGTMILEFAALSRLTGEPIFEEKAQRAMEMLWKARHRTSNLVGTVINIHNGDWVRRESGVGAGIDSYYEYLLKAYILLGEETYLDRFNKHYAAIMKYVNQGPLLVDVHMHKPLTNSRNFMDSLLAFWPGLQVLKGDIKPAIEIHEILYQVTQRHNFLPEAFTTDFRVHWPQHPLRPEFVESTYLIYKATGDPYYQEVGKTVIDNLNQHARVDCGFASIRDVTTGTKEDQMDSFVLAETFKYLYLLFTEKEDLLIDIDDYIFTTEAHMLPLSLAMTSLKTNASEKSYLFTSYDEDDDDNYERTCPNTNHLFRGNVNFAQSLRTPLKNMVENLCPKPRAGRRPRLHASQFMAGNKEQLEELKRMGIRLVTMNDGRVQLLHTASDAASPDDAEDGMHFMQEMIELSKTQAQEAQQEARVIQFVSAPFLGSVVLNSGPAQFGPDLRNNDGIIGKVVVTEPFRACQPIQNADVVRGQIAVAERGDCMFIDKARHMEAAGAIAGIITDNKVGTNSDTTPMFAMSGDGKDDISIPFSFLFYTEGRNLLQTAILYDTLKVHMGVQPKDTESIQRWIEGELSEGSEDESELDDGECKASDSPDLMKSPMTSQSGDDKEYDVSSDLKLLLEKVTKSMKPDDIIDKVDLELETKDEVEAFFRYIQHTKHLSHFTVQVGSDATTDTNHRKAKMLKQIRLRSDKTNGEDSKIDVETNLQANHKNNENDGQSFYKANHEDRSFSQFKEKSQGKGIHVKVTSGVRDSGENEMEKAIDEALDDFFNSKLLTLFGETTAVIGSEQGEDSNWNDKPTPTEAPSYATPEDLSAWHTHEQKPRARFKKAPDWMSLRDGELFVDRNGNIFSNDGQDNDPNEPRAESDNRQFRHLDDSGISSGDEDEVENYNDKPVHRTLEFVSFGNVEDTVSLEKDFEESPNSGVDNDDTQALQDDGENLAGGLEFDKVTSQPSRDNKDGRAENFNQRFRAVEAEEYYENRNKEMDSDGHEGNLKTIEALADLSLHSNNKHYIADAQDNIHNFHRYVPNQDNIAKDSASLQDEPTATVLIGNHESHDTNSAQETTSISSSEVDASLPVESGQHRTKHLTQVEPDIPSSSSGSSRTNIGDLEQDYPDYQKDEL